MPSQPRPRLPLPAVRSLYARSRRGLVAVLAVGALAVSPVGCAGPSAAVAPKNPGPSAEPEVGRAASTTVAAPSPAAARLSIDPAGSGAAGTAPTPTPGASTSAPRFAVPAVAGAPASAATSTPSRTWAAAASATTATAVTTTTALPTVRWGLIGNDGTHLSAERSAGIATKVFELGWSSYEPASGAFSSSYITAKRNEAAKLRAAGFTLILSFGIQYTPSWVMGLPNAYYRNQYGTLYNDTSSGSGRANVIWNDSIRSLVARYIARVFADLGTSWAAVRVGGGRYGELGYPVAKYGTQANTYWAFDANAARTDPVPGWKPGMASPNGEASKFANWYLNRLANYATWQVATVRAHYTGRLMVLFPSFGIRPGQLAAAIAGHLSGGTSAEKNGEVPRGYDYARQVKALSAYSGIVLTTTWLDCPYGNDSSTNPVDWRPVHYLAYLAGPYGMARYGENTGWGSRSVMSFTASQAKKYGLLGFAWFNEPQLFGGTYATLANYATIIRAG